MSDGVNVWAEKVVIPTYKIGTPDKNPMFLEKRVYQGSSGVVYPHPVIDRVFDEKEDKEYTAVFIENRYLKIMVLPEIGGRVQMALDKTNGYHFVYYNRVIKPALVGLAGPWISGGIEFNWPQHHRPSTFDPVNWTIQEHADGRKPYGARKSSTCSIPKACTASLYTPSAATWKFGSSCITGPLNPRPFCGGQIRLCPFMMNINLSFRRTCMR
jgi:hypothetical protein